MDKEFIELSIIIPCYNVEKYLNRCLANLINTPFELILVDDGSTDSTSKICDIYSKYNNIKIYHKENGGLSDARNFGIEKASGKYLAFLDSDDYIDVNRLYEVLKILQNLEADLIYCDFYKEDINGNIFKQNSIENIEISDGITGMKKLISSHKYFPMVWKNIYRRDFIINNSLFFKIGYLHEDVDWTPRVLFKSKKVIFCNEAFYYYCYNNKSITHQKTDKNFIDIINIVKEIRGDLQTGLNKNLKDIDEYFISRYMAAYIQYDKEKMHFKYKDIKARHLKIKYLVLKYIRKKYIRKIYKIRLYYKNKKKIMY